MKKENYQQYNTNGKLVQSPTSVPLDELTNGYVVKNIGNTICTINRDPLQPGESKSVGGNEGEIYIGRCDINFYRMDSNLNLIPAAQTIPAVNGAYITIKYFLTGSTYDRL